MAELRGIQLAGFKSIREMDLTLGSLNILIGANGSGKSNFVSLFTLLGHLACGDLQGHVGRRGGADPFLHFGRKRTAELRCLLRFADSSLYSFRLAAGVRDNLLFAGEGYWLSGEPPWETGFVPGLSGYPESVLTELATVSGGESLARTLRVIRQRLKGWWAYHFHDTSDTAKVKQSCDLHDNQFLRTDASNLAAFLYWLEEKHEAHYGNIVDAVRMVAPFFDDFDLHPSRLNEKVIRLEWRERGSDAYFGPESLSDGTLRFTCLATLLLQPDPLPLMVIDEPELGLHPAAITLVASMLRSAAVKTQVIACTQSVTLVNQFEPADIVVVDREEGQSVLKRLTEEQVKGWLDEYALGDLWEKNLIGGRP